ncbi:uncharacterized protein LOC110996870 [Pieris rapae]|uniref:uncharacterized protein LOC110996870 n=1 Tax=Pieris rapae TaxID=64459 RepID=UPI000B92B377|nr:uncharacterized protein LOC110996870 [Pieris rapae]
MEKAKSDTELPNKLADLKLMETQSEETESTTRVLRKRKQTSPENKSTNRRVSMKPRKHIPVTETGNSKQIESIYLNNKIKKTSSQTLETIFEEPKNGNTDCNNVMSRRKVKRLLTFHLGSHYTKDKIKRRREKIKKLRGNAFLSRKRIPMDVVLETLEALQSDEETSTKNKTTESVTV